MIKSLHEYGVKAILKIIVLEIINVMAITLMVVTLGLTFAIKIRERPLETEASIIDIICGYTIHYIFSVSTTILFFTY